MKYIFDLRTIPEEKLSVSGGKAASLSLMMKNLKMNIPMGYVITAEGFRDGKLTDEASEELNDTIAKLDRLKTYAVRSSAIGEDGENNSFAGQYETLTDVRVAEIRNAVSYVAASAKSDDIVALREGETLVMKKFESVLNTAGIKAIECVGMPFNEEEQEAVARFAAGEDKRGLVIDCVQRGYKMGDHVLRYAKVVVGE